jgi:two-component system, OmpR family, sensor histidine kinase KdpD
MDDELEPDELLARIQKEAITRTRFKIFFGMAAGVGKTYAMLREAQLLIERGEDVVIGWLEPHGRTETESLGVGMERVPPKIIDYHGAHLEELDAEAVIRRKPAIVLVDELAHSNATGMNHPKRYQDILDILDAGIPVYTTMNIQHLESIADSVELSTLVPIRERVPDEVFDRADEIQLIDIPPEELIERLSEGKIYSGDISREAMNNFFTRENLGVLRELALHHAAQLASNQLLDIMRGDHTRKFAGAQRILVAVSQSPNSENLIRWTRKLVYALKASWECVTIDSGAELSEDEKKRLSENLSFAKSLGAAVSTIPGNEIVRTVLDYAKQTGASIIVVGKSGASPKNNPFARKSITERIIAESGEIAVFAVQERSVHEIMRRRIGTKISTSSPWQYLIAVAGVALTTGLNAIITPYTGYWGASILYLALISVLALGINRGPVLIAALLSALLWDFIFIPPYHTLYIQKVEDALMLFLYILLAVTSGWMTSKLKANERLLAVRERRLELLSALASDLAGTPGQKETIAKSARFLHDAFDAEVVFLMGDERRDLSAVAANAPEIVVNEKEMNAARRCFLTGKHTGRHTDTLPLGDWYFAPLGTPTSTIGVVGFKSPHEQTWANDHERFLAIILRTVSLAIEREMFAEAAKASELLAESDRLGKLLLNSVSHELKTPLTIIQGSASALSDATLAIDPQTRSELIGEIVSGTERLTRIVDNLLSMNRLEAGRINLHRSETDPGDLASTALQLLNKDQDGHSVEIVNDGSARPLRCDERLIVQVLTNLLENAFRYSGEKSRIVVRIAQTDLTTQFEVSDDGPGVPPGDLPHLFEKFYRGKDAKPGGTGLGLAICKGIVEVHGGTIRAENIGRNESARPRTGFTVSFTLPNNPRAEKA